MTHCLDARFKGAAVFEHRSLDAASASDCPEDEVIRNLKQRRRSSPAQLLQQWIIMAENDPGFHFAAACAGGGGLCLGTSGGLLGLVVGATTGTAIGLVPAVLTLGMSVPVGAVSGGAIGSGVGGVAGGTAGFLGGGFFGGVLYERRYEVWERMESTRMGLETRAARACSSAAGMVATGKAKASQTLVRVRTTSVGTAVAIGSLPANACSTASMKAAELSTGVQNTIMDRKVRVVAASAASGGVCMGVSGGAVGLLVGSATGAAWGVIPALLTFGLSIPVCATLAGGVGLCVGATAGAASGFVGGGVAGYGASLLTRDSPPSREAVTPASPQRHTAQAASLAAAASVVAERRAEGLAEGGSQPEWVGGEAEETQDRRGAASVP